MDGHVESDACAALDTTLIPVDQYFDAWDFEGGALVATHAGSDVFHPATG
ncbi:MAG: hypothetical protein WD007_03260 [Nitriliruptoraceae bacterium]